MLEARLRKAFVYVSTHSVFAGRLSVNVARSLLSHQKLSRAAHVESFPIYSKKPPRAWVAWALTSFSSNEEAFTELF